MTDIGKPLEKEDYVEPRCVLCGDPYGAEPKVKPIPQQRVREKLDEYMSRRDYAGAERHLLYWLEEAKLGGDERGQLFVQNELIGHYRKDGKKEQAFAAADEALRLLDALDMGDTLSAGTTYTNAATAMNAFGGNEKALALFEKAKQVYEANPHTGAGLLGGLYNNMALTCVALKDFARAHALYDKAMDLMGTQPNGQLEQAITCLNRADALTAEKGMEAAESGVYDLLDRAEELLKTPGIPRDGYYAFVCEKCAPSFDYHGYFAAAQELKKEAQSIYERP